MSDILLSPEEIEDVLRKDNVNYVAKAQLRHTLEWLEEDCPHEHWSRVDNRRGCWRCMAEARKAAGME